MHDVGLRRRSGFSPSAAARSCSTNNSVFWAYHGLTAGSVQTAGRTTSWTPKPSSAKRPIQWLCHCSLTWCLPPWKGIAAENSTAGA